MRRMDPSFAKELNSNNPEGYRKALGRSRRNAKLSNAADVHVSMIPAQLTRFVSGVAVMLFLIAGFYFISQSTEARALGLPSGPVLTGVSQEISIGRDLSGKIASMEKGPRDLQARVDPIGDIRENFARSWDR